MTSPRLAVAALAAALGPCLAAQATPLQRPTFPDFLREWREAAGDPEARVTLCREYLTAHHDSSPRESGTLAVRARLAATLLSLHELDAATEAFQELYDRAPPDDRDHRPRAAFGLAQIDHLRGERMAAAEQLEEITERHPGTRYGRIARTALAILQRPDRARVGRSAPDLGVRIDLNERPRDLESLLKLPVVLVFFDTSDPDATATLHSLQRAWRRAGLEDGQVLALALDAGASSRELARRIERLQWPTPVLPLEGGYLHELPLLYGVRRAPSWFLIAPDKTLIGRDLPAERLEATLRVLLDQG